MPADPIPPCAAPVLSDPVRLELTRLLAELNPPPHVPSADDVREPVVSGWTPTDDDTAVRVTGAEAAIALGRPVHPSGLDAVGLAASALFIGGWLVSAWGAMVPVRPHESASLAAAAGSSADPGRMTEVQSARDVVHLWAQGGVGSARTIRGQMWWSPSQGMALWARAEPLSEQDGLGYQAWFVSDTGTQYLGPITADQTGTISVALAPPPHATGRPVRVLVTLQSPRRLEHPADRVVLEARF